MSLTLTVNPSHPIKNWCRPDMPLHLYNLQIPLHSFTVQYLEGMPILPWNMSTTQLRTAKQGLARVLHPDKQRYVSTTTLHRAKVERAIRLVLDAHSTLTGDDLAAKTYMRGCWILQFLDPRVFGSLGNGRWRSLCDVRPIELMNYGDWLIELLHLQTGSGARGAGRDGGEEDYQWLNALGKSINRDWDWGWGYRYDESGQRALREWGGPPNMPLSFLDRCEEIVLLVPRTLYMRPESLWRSAVASGRLELGTKKEEMNELMMFWNPALAMKFVGFHWMLSLLLFWLGYLGLKRLRRRLRREVLAMKRKRYVAALEEIIGRLYIVCYLLWSC